MSWGIYKHTCYKTGKSYIGQTCKNFEHRWNYGEGYKKQKKFYNAIKKYKWDGFSHEIIEKDIPTQKLANEREIYWIKFYDSINNGYNILIGGSDMCGDHNPFYGKKHSKKTIQKYIETGDRIYCVETGKKYISPSRAAIKLGVDPSSVRSALRDGSRVRNRKTNKYYHFRYQDESKNLVELKEGKIKEIICLETKKIYPSAVEPAKEYHVDRHLITMACRGECMTGGGKHWLYLEDYKTKKRKEIKEILKINENLVGRKLQVYCYENKKTYNSAQEAIAELKLNANVFYHLTRKSNKFVCDGKLFKVSK